MGYCDHNRGPEPATRDRLGSREGDREMQLAEPMTVLTDYVLAGLGLWLGLRLLRDANGTGGFRRSCIA